MRTKLLIAATVAVVVLLLTLGTGYWVVFGPNTTDFDGERGVHIPRGATFSTMLDSLEVREVLDSRTTMELMGRATGWGGQVKAGYYTFESGASNYDMLDRIRKGHQSPVKLTIPPGSRPEVVAAVAARDMDFSRDDLLSALRDSSLAAELDTDTTHLFAYMMPETYQFFWLTPAERVVRRVKEDFDRFFDDEMRQQADSLNLTTDEIVTLASIIEWETDHVEERPRIAGVYLNRLRIGMPLQADPTVQYAVLEEEGQRRRLFYNDYEIDHPYNTYDFRGLPPGPLTNPAASSVRAVVYPEDHDYLYFVATGDGDHVFSRTLQEHNRAAQQYRDRMRELRRQAEADTMD